MTGRIIRQFQGHHQKVNTLHFNEDSSVLASGSDDKSVRLWDMRAASSRYPIQILEDAKDSIGSICIRGAVIAVGSVDGHVRIYDIRKGGMTSDKLNGKKINKHFLIHSLFSSIHVDAVTSVKLGMDSQCYLASTAASTVKLIDGPSGKTLNTFTGHNQEKYRLESTFTADESTVISGSEDSSIFLWDTLSGQIVNKLTGHSGAVVSVSSHPKNNQILLSASADGTIKLWN